jgi:hypothetical protein
VWNLSIWYTLRDLVRSGNLTEELEGYQSNVSFTEGFSPSFMQGVVV